MGVFILHEWARLLAMSSGVYVIWAGIWGILYRKFFWDMIDGVLGPKGIIPGANSTFFVSIIVDLPVLQIVNIANGVLTICIDYPLPIRSMTNSGLYRSLPARLVFYIWCSFIAFLPYQTVDAGVYYAVTSLVLLKAISQGERMQVAKENRLRGSTSRA